MQRYTFDVTNRLGYVISNLLLDLSQEVRFWSVPIVYIFYRYESKILQPKQKITELNEIIVIIRRSTNEHIYV